MATFGQEYRERPILRKDIEDLVKEGKTLTEIISSFRYGNELKIQAKKMLSELNEVKNGT